MAAAAAGSLSVVSPVQDLRVTEFSGECLPDRLYLNTNEKDQEKTLDMMQRAKIVGNTYLGTSALFNLNVVAVRENIEYVIIYDRSYAVHLFWQLFIEILKASEDRKNALVRLEKMLKRKEVIFFSKSIRPQERLPALLRKRIGLETSINISKLHDEIRSNISFLSDDIRYDRIRELALKGRIKCLRMDLENSTSFEKLASQLSERNLIIDILYVSNTRQYCAPENYLCSLRPLVLNSPIIISSLRTEEGIYLQKVRCYKDLSKELEFLVNG